MMILEKQEFDVAAEDNKVIKEPARGRKQCVSAGRE